MNRKREAVFMGLDILTGLALSGPVVQATNCLTVRPSSRTFYINGQQTALIAYAIGTSTALAGPCCVLSPPSVPYHGSGWTARVEADPLIKAASLFPAMLAGARSFPQNRILWGSVFSISSA